MQIQQARLHLLKRSLTLTIIDHKQHLMMKMFCLMHGIISWIHHANDFNDGEI